MVQALFRVALVEVPSATDILGAKVKHDDTPCAAKMPLTSMTTKRVFIAVAALLHVTIGGAAAESLAAVEVHADQGGAVANGIINAPNGVAEKTVLSSRFRLVFAVGLEGTGHHYFIPALQRVFEDNEDLARIEACSVLPPHFVAHTLVRSPSVYADALDAAVIAMRDLAAEAEELEEPGTFAPTQQQQRHQKGCGRVFSYPCCSGRDRVFKYLDVVTLAQAAEAAGVDLRVVYLQRSAKDIMLADASHRSIQK